MMSPPIRQPKSAVKTKSARSWSLAPPSAGERIALVLDMMQVFRSVLAVHRSGVSGPGSLKSGVA